MDEVSRSQGPREGAQTTSGEEAVGRGAASTFTSLSTSAGTLSGTHWANSEQDASEGLPGQGSVRGSPEYPQGVTG